MVNRVGALPRFGLSGETWRLAATFLATEIDPIRSTVGSWRQDGEELKAFVPQLIGFLDRVDNLVLERHVSA